MFSRILKQITHNSHFQSITFATNFQKMFNRYWRTYPVFMQIIQLGILLLVLFSFFGMGITPVILKLSDVSQEAFLNLSDKSPRNVINAALWVQFITAVGIFLLPAFLFAYFTHPRPVEYLGLRAPKKMSHILFCILIIISATPLFLTIAEWMSHINIAAAKEAQEVNDRYMKAFLSMNSVGQLLISLFVLAVLAGLSEELFFRSIVMRFGTKTTRSIVLGIIISALLFAMMHSNIYGLPSIFLAGILLGTFYYLTGSIWCGIIAHVIYNGFQVVIVYLSDNNPTIAAINETNHVPYSWVITGTLISIVTFYFLWKTRTPLSSDWTNDYSKEEMERREMESER